MVSMSRYLFNYGYGVRRRTVVEERTGWMVELY